MLQPPLWRLISPLPGGRNDPSQAGLGDRSRAQVGAPAARHGGCAGGGHAGWRAGDRGRGLAFGPIAPCPERSRRIASAPNRVSDTCVNWYTWPTCGEAHQSAGTSRGPQSERLGPAPPAGSNRHAAWISVAASGGSLLWAAATRCGTSGSCPHRRFLARRAFPGHRRRRRAGADLGRCLRETSRHATLRARGEFRLLFARWQIDRVGRK